MKNIILEQSKILSSAVVGFEWEFYSEKTRKEISQELGRILHKKIKVGNVYHSDTPVGPGEWKLEPDFSGGTKMNELITDPNAVYRGYSLFNESFNLYQRKWLD